MVPTNSALLETLPGNLYDHPKYYDLVFGSDWKAEFDFLQACFAKHADRTVRTLFEPACGTGRLMIKFAQAGYEVAGNDLCEKAIDYCNARLARNGFATSAVVGNMADFHLRPGVDAAYNMINSFRHLNRESQALSHLQCVADSLAPGGIYVLGFHLTPTQGTPLSEESWSARRGPLAVLSHMCTIDVDLAQRTEWVDMTFDVYTPTRSFQLSEKIPFRTYTARQMLRLLKRVKSLDIVATYDFAYDSDHPIRVGPETEDVVYVLKK